MSPTTNRSIYVLIAVFAISLVWSWAQAFQSNRLSTSSGLVSPRSGIGMVTISGPIAFETTRSVLGDSGAQSIIKQIKALKKDSRVKALMIRINSPGGTVGASQELFDAIQQFKQDTQVPVVASIGDIGTSGAYYAALGADVIFANAGSMVGSIGVILANMNFEELGRKYGIDMMVYKSGKHKDILSSWREETPEEERLLNDLVTNVHQQFVDALIEGRSLSRQTANQVADGRFFSGQQAQALGLVDTLGGYDQALDYLIKEAKLSEDPLIINKSQPRFDDLMSFWADQMGSRLSIMSFMPRLF